MVLENGFMLSRKYYYSSQYMRESGGGGDERWRGSHSLIYFSFIFFVRLPLPLLFCPVSLFFLQGD
jgi:hypothetical protein